MYNSYYFDWTYLLVLLGAALSLLASSNVKHTFNKYQKVRAKNSMTGEQAAACILSQNEIYNVEITGIQGNLTDNYVPSRKILHLSESTKDSSSIAAIGVAAHECGHAIQDAVGYAPLRVTRTIGPVSAFASRISMPLIFFGFVIGMTSLVNVGILVFVVAIAYQVLTLPVEFDASRRALETLRSQGMLDEEELDGVRKVLGAAALTYVAAAAAALLQLLRLVMLSNRRSRR